MAVYTLIDEDLLNSFLKNYKIGDLINFEGIEEGIENSNYRITTTKGKYILTIFEKRVKEKDLPFFVELKKHFVQKNFKCPEPISNQKGDYIDKIKNKPCIICTFLEGKKIENVTVSHCDQLGTQLALMHIHAYDFKHYRQNTLGCQHWRKLFESFKDNASQKYQKIFYDINKEISFLKKNWVKDMPTGVIHADVFQDNVFFINGIFSGIIDFYFACNDYYAYELAICLNAWCFERNKILNIEKSSTLINSYQKHRKLSKSEKLSLPILLRGAAMRILLTRLHDEIYHPVGAFVQPKDPTEYIKILKFHQNNNDLIKI